MRALLITASIVVASLCVSSRAPLLLGESAFAADRGVPGHSHAPPPPTAPPGPSPSPSRPAPPPGLPPGLGDMNRIREQWRSDQHPPTDPQPKVVFTGETPPTDGTPFKTVPMTREEFGKWVKLLREAGPADVIHPQVAQLAPPHAESDAGAMSASREAWDRDIDTFRRDSALVVERNDVKVVLATAMLRVVGVAYWVTRKVAEAGIEAVAGPAVAVGVAIIGSGVEALPPVAQRPRDDTEPDRLERRGAMVEEGAATEAAAKTIAKGIEAGLGAVSGGKVTIPNLDDAIAYAIGLYNTGARETRNRARSAGRLLEPGYTYYLQSGLSPQPGM